MQLGVSAQGTAMPLSNCGIQHSIENPLTSAGSFSVRTKLQKVQHAVLFSWATYPAEIEDFHLLRRTGFPRSNTPQCQHADNFTSRKWLVQDRLAGAMVRHGDRVFSRVGQP